MPMMRSAQLHPQLSSLAATGLADAFGMPECLKGSLDVIILSSSLVKLRFVGPNFLGLNLLRCARVRREMESHILSLFDLAAGGAQVYLCFWSQCKHYLMLT